LKVTEAGEEAMSAANATDADRKPTIAKRIIFMEGTLLSLALYDRSSGTTRSASDYSG
jgi:hypothetical protein